MTPEDRKRIEAIRAYMGTIEGEFMSSDAQAHLLWLLDLVERQEAALAETSMVLQSMAEIATGERLTTLAELKERYGPIEVDASGERVAKREELGRTEDGIS